MPRVSLPPGCYGLRDDVRGKSTEKVKPGSSVVISDEAARKIKGSRNGQLGIISPSQALTIGTRGGRRCMDCGFLAQAWSHTCPRCDGATEKE